MSEFGFRQPFTDSYNGLTFQLGYSEPGFLNIYLQRNQAAAPALSARFDERAQAIYAGLDPKTVFFPEAQHKNYPDYPKRELQAVADALNEKGQQSLRMARAAFSLKHVLWLGLASEDDMVIISRRQATNKELDTVKDGIGSFTRSPQTDIGIVGPKRDNDPSLTLAMGVADCLAIPIVDERTLAFGFAHAGRPGTGKRTSQKAAAGIVEEFKSNPKDLTAHLGEGVCMACYKVDEKTFEGFSKDFGGKAELDKVEEQYPEAVIKIETAEGVRYAIDLYAFNKYLLAAQGVGEIVTTTNCTARSNRHCVSLDQDAVPEEADQNYFSHERVKGKTVGWRTVSGEMLEFNTFHLTTPRNLAAITRR